MLKLTTDKQTDRQTDRQTNKQTGQKQYAPDHSIRGHKKKSTPMSEISFYTFFYKKYKRVHVCLMGILQLETKHNEFHNDFDHRCTSGNSINKKCSHHQKVIKLN